MPAVKELHVQSFKCNARQADQVAQQPGVLSGWLGRVTSSFSESDDEGTARRSGSTSVSGTGSKRWGSGIVTVLSGGTGTGRCARRQEVSLLGHLCALYVK